MLDIITTLFVLGTGYLAGDITTLEAELMPLARIALSLGPIWFIVLKLLTATGLIGLVAWLRNTRSRRIIWRALTFLMTLIVIINVVNIYILYS